MVARVLFLWLPFCGNTTPPPTTGDASVPSPTD